jgi:hypothetical protein
MASIAELSYLEVVVPVPEYQDEIHPATTKFPERPASIKGTTIALLPNWKAICPPIMEVLAQRFNKDTDVKHAFMYNPDWQFTHPERVAKIGPEVDELVKKCDLMVSGVGDCGGCTLWSCKAGVEFEKRGIPATVIVTDIFEKRAHQLLQSLGYPHIPVIVTANPVCYLTEPETNQRIDQFLSGLVESLCTPKSGGSNGRG